MQIWDTAGQERYKTITQNYYKGSAGIILTYSITEPKSFENIGSKLYYSERWVTQINEFAPKDVIKILVGNKCDL